MHLPRKLLAIALTVPAVLGLSACTLPGASSTTATSVGSPAATAFPAMADVTITSCSGTAGAWTAAGTVHNPTATAATYSFGIGVEDAQGAGIDEMAGEAGAVVKPAATVPWKATVSGLTGAPSTCTLDWVNRV